jgi:phosphohistidine phosphatase
MKILTLVRHAKSDWGDRRLSDSQRALSLRGERDAPIMGQRVAALGIRPSLMITSPAVRAYTTARYFAKELGYPLEFLQRDQSLYLANLQDLLGVVAALDAGFNSLMLFGHNPGMTEFANFLVPGLTNNLPTAGVVAVRVEQDDWNLYHQPSTELISYNYPKNSD